MKKNCVKAVCAAFLLTFGVFVSPAFAQRTVQGQFFADVNYIHTVAPMSKPPVLGGELFVGQYLANCYWQAGFQMTPPTKKSYLTEDGTGFVHQYGCFLASGGMMYRFFGTRNRVFSLYGGGNALFGLDFPDFGAAAQNVFVDKESGRISDKTEDLKASIVYGLEPRLEAEIYFSRKAAVVLGVAVPVRISTKNNGTITEEYEGTRLVTLRAFGGLRLAF